MRYLGIDYGRKRVGVAYADELGVAVPLRALLVEGRKGQLRAIAELVEARGVEAVVLGIPYNMNGSAGFMAQEAEAFAAELERRLAVPVHRVDERLTSSEVEAGLKETGRRGRSDKRVRASGEVDSRAAVLILRDFLSTVETSVPPPVDFDPDEEL